MFRVHVAGEANERIQQCDRCDEVLIDRRKTPAEFFRPGTFVMMLESGNSRAMVGMDRDADPAQGEVQCDEGRRTGQIRKERGKSLVGLTIPARVFAMGLLAVVAFAQGPSIASPIAPNVDQSDLYLRLYARRADASNLDVLPPQGVQGVTDPKVTQANIQETICKPLYTAAVRDVGESEKKQVYARDGVKPDMPRCCEVDHLISLELGGANSLGNLWAQRYEPFPGARDKDKVETALHRDVCAGKLTLKEAQAIIRSDWFAEYKRWFGNKRVTK